MKQLKPFKRTLQRMTGTNLMLRGLSLMGHHSQTDTDDTEVHGELRLWERVSQIEVCMADAVTFVVSGVPLFKLRARTSCAFSVVASHKGPVIKHNNINGALTQS